ncbi:hypothetical protein ACLIBH_00980 [Virgibacillus sp. W0430]|uniref:hypothetical protein n=1 Tax=Virgibacillus sp. W0430 TaxID=3391580 RepID=UPI003F473969
MNYLKLLNFELNRFTKVYAGLLLLTAISQFVGLFWRTNNYLKEAKGLIQRGGMTQTTFVEQYGQLDMYQVMQSLLYYFPIAICAGSLMFYIFLIWYRDWFGKNTFIYRLLMLPTSRINVVLAKATAIMLAVLGLVAFQYVLIISQSTILKWLVPKGLRLDLTVTEIVSNQHYLSIILPQTFIQFLLNYGLGLTFLMVCFTVILFERSYRLKGAIIGVLYGLVMLVLFFAPLLILFFIFEKEILYPEEILLTQVAIGTIILILSTWISCYLIKNKVTV